MYHVSVQGIDERKINVQYYYYHRYYGYYYTYINIHICLYRDPTSLTNVLSKWPTELAKGTGALEMSRFVPAV